MESKSAARLVRHNTLHFSERGGLSGGSAEIAWAIPPGGTSPLMAGIGRCHAMQAPFKTLDYDEVILVRSGVLTVALGDGRSFEAHAGDVVELPRGTAVQYGGTHAEFWFVVTPS